MRGRQYKTQQDVWSAWDWSLGHSPLVFFLVIDLCIMHAFLSVETTDDVDLSFNVVALKSDLCMFIGAISVP